MNDTTTAALSADERRRSLRTAEGDAVTRQKDLVIIKIEDLGEKDGLPTALVRGTLDAVDGVIDQVLLTGYADPAALVAAVNEGRSAIAALGSESDASNGTVATVNATDGDLAALTALKQLAGPIPLPQFVANIAAMLQGLNSDRDSMPTKLNVINGVADGTIGVTSDGKIQDVADAEDRADRVAAELSQFVADLKSQMGGPVTVSGPSGHVETGQTVIVVNALPHRALDKLR